MGKYKIQVRDLADPLGNWGWMKGFESLPGGSRCMIIFPQTPFNPETRIRFEIANQENVQFIIYDILGQGSKPFGK
ncbi:MAG: hypothetical protein CM1200mP10_26250 [Candidatus Neomarinimicrobiota bacterium]|nr:MAG: hypothetical protein CM1200mP10_26250 [Candidatus Neomarinimicrobiota bacterium]